MQFSIVKWCHQKKKKKTNDETNVERRWNDITFTNILDLYEKERWHFVCHSSIKHILAPNNTISCNFFELFGKITIYKCSLTENANYLVKAMNKFAIFFINVKKNTKQNLGEKLTILLMRSWLSNKWNLNLKV
jgi:hypothetical protein